MKNILHFVMVSLGALGLVSCTHNDLRPSVEKKVDAAMLTNLDPLGLGDSPVSFERRKSNACPGTEGEAMWHIKLSGINAVKVTYGVRSKGTDTGQRNTLSLDPNFRRERSMFCAGDGVNLDFEPFVVEVS